MPFRRHGIRFVARMVESLASLVTDVDAAFKQNVLDLAQRQRIADVHHHREADDFGRPVEVSNGVVHHRRRRELAVRLKPIFLDNAFGIGRQAAPGWRHANGSVPRAWGEPCVSTLGLVQQKR